MEFSSFVNKIQRVCSQRSKHPCVKGLTLVINKMINDILGFNWIAVLCILIFDIILKITTTSKTDIDSYLKKDTQSLLTLAVLWPNILGHEIMLLWTVAQYIGFVMAAIATAPQALETLL